MQLTTNLYTKSRYNAGTYFMKKYLFIFLLACCIHTQVQAYTYVVGINLGVFDSRQLKSGESLYIPPGVTAFCDFQVVGTNVQIVNEGTWLPSQSALELGALLTNSGVLNATFLQVNNGKFINRGLASYTDLTVAAGANVENTTTGRLHVGGTLRLAGRLLNCGQLITGRYELVTGGVLAGCSALPVTLLSFTGHTVARGALLEWAVAQEVNVARYEVERSADGVSWALAGTVAAANKPTYSLLDKPSPAKVYYRLRSVDNDATATYSPVVVLAGSGLVSSTFYNEVGQLIPEPTAGFCIRVDVYENGAIERKKIYIR